MCYYELFVRYSIRLSAVQKRQTWVWFPTDVNAPCKPLQNMCVQGLSSEPEEADANNVSSPPQHTSDTSSLSGGVLSVDHEVGGSDQCVDGGVFVEHTAIQLCDHCTQDGSCEDGVVLHRVGVGRLNATQLVQLLLGHLAL